MITGVSSGKNGGSAVRLPERHSSPRLLSIGEMLELKRWNTPTIYNGWEQITQHNISAAAFNIEETHDFMPQMGPMVGRAVTVVIEPSNRTHPKARPTAWSEYRRYVASVPGPKIVIVQDLDKPGAIGAFWGEVNSTIHRALGCVGSIVDGAIRDIDEMTNAGFKVLARRLCVGHAFSYPVHWDCPVEVFGRMISPGQLIHADKHGFLAVPPEDEDRLLDSARFMDSNECKTLIAAAKSTSGLPVERILTQIDEAGARFTAAALEKFGCKGEW